MTAPTLVRDDDELTRAAIRAYQNAAVQAGAVAVDQPANSSGVVEHDGKRYVVLVNVNGTLAVYRVRGDGALKELRRWPAEVAEPF